MPSTELENDKYLVMVTPKGTIKKTAIEDFGSVRRSGLIALKLKGDDNLEWVKPSKGAENIVLITSGGQAIRFDEKNVRAMGRAASGVKGIKLKSSDKVVGMGILDTKEKKNLKLLVIMEKGFGKQTEIGAYKVQGRGGSGIKTAKITTKTGKIVSGMIIDDPEKDLIIISTKGQVIRLDIRAVNILGRDTQGVRVMRFKDVNDTVANVTLI